MSLPGTHHLKFIDATVSTSYVCEVHGHILPEEITDGTKTELACPHCLEEGEHAEARAKPEIITPRGLSINAALSAVDSGNGSFACPWCQEKFKRYWDLHEHQDICPRINSCIYEKCNREVVGKCVGCASTACSEHLRVDGICSLCAEFMSPS